MSTMKKIPDIKGMKIDKAIEILEKEKIKYNEDYIYKAKVFKRNDIVIKTDPEAGEKYDGKKKLDIYVSRFIPLPLILILFVLLALTPLFFNMGRSKLDYLEYRSPFIVVEKEGWAKENVVYVTKDASLENIKYYEYCVRQDEKKEECEWKRTDTKSVVISTTGIWNVWFRAVNDREYSNISNMVTVYIDNESPDISGELEVEIGDKTVTVEVRARDNECGLAGEYYSIDGKNYKELINNEITGLKANTRYTIYIKIVDCAGNEKIITKEIKTNKKGETKIPDDKCEINCDTDGDGTCDRNCDEDKDGKCDKNCDLDKDGKCDLNCDTDGDGTCDINCDTDGDGKCDLNCDEDKDGTCDLNCDTNGDGTCDRNCDDDKDGLCDRECDLDKDKIVPEISLRDVPAVIKYGDNYPLPSWYKFGPTGGEVECKDQNSNIITDTTKLGIGEYKIRCVARGNNGLSASTSKEIRVDYQEGSDEEWDGWVLLNLYYPDNSTNRMWRLNSDNALRDGSNGSDWQPYVGPIKVKIEDVGNVYIKYDLDGAEIVEQQGRPIVDIRPESFEVYDFDRTYVEIKYDEEAITKEYRINGGEWQEYSEGFFVGPKTVIEARVTKELKTYNTSTGEELSRRTVGNTDAVFIKEREWNASSLFGNVQISIDATPWEVNGEEKSTVRINYATDAENRRYRINYGEWKDYVGEFEVTRNTVIEAKASATRSVTTREGNVFSGVTTGYDWEKVYDGEDSNSYRVYLSAPEDIDVTERADVYVSTDHNLQKLEYQVNGGEWQNAEVRSHSKYKLVNVGVNTTVSVRAKYKDNDNNDRWAWDSLTVGEDKNGLRVYINSENDIPYGTKTPVSISVNYPTNYVRYRINGGEWKEYTGTFKVDNNTYVEAVAEKTNSDGSKQTKYAAKYIGTSLLRVEINAPSYLYVDQVGKATISANYSGTRLYYSLDGTNWTRYTKAISVIGGTRVYARGEYTDPDGIIRTDTRNVYVTLMNNLGGPTIRANKTGETTTPVEITMTSAYEGDIYYSINGGTTKKYTGPFSVSSNCHITAYTIRKSDGLKSRTNYYRVDNIRNTNKPTVNIVATPNPYTTVGLVDKVSVRIEAYDYNLVEYSFDGIYYRAYHGEFNVTNNTTVYARAKNINGYSYDELTINNVNPIKPTKLESEIIIDPNGQNKYNSVNEVKVRLVYDERATVKKYKLGNNDTWHDYEEPFNITRNTTIYLYETNEEIRGLGTNERIVNFLPIGLTDPEILANPKNGIIASDVDVQIEYDSAATVRKYSIDGGSLQNYNGSFNIEKNNTTIYAYSEDINHNIATSTYTITNIHDITTAVLDKGKYYLIKLNYPTTSDPEQREYRYGEDGEWKKYPSEGILLIKPEYKDELIHDDILVIKLQDEEGNEVEFKGDWYIIDDSLANIIANIGMRWSTGEIPTPVIIPDTTNWTSKLGITIDYVSKMKEYKYKIVYKDGRTTGWIDYIGPFEVEENEAVIYAKSLNENEVWSKEASYKVENVDNGNPGVRYINVVETTTGTIKVSVDGLNDEGNIREYYFSTDNEHYEASDTKEYTYKGLSADTEYTLYVYTVDYDGNKGEVYHITAKTNAKEEPIIGFEPALDEWSENKKVFINHVDSNMPLYYSFDNGATWEEYTEPITVEHNCTIMAKADDGVNETRTANYEINTIDDTKPIVTSVIYAPRSSRLIINATGEDAESEVKHYLYSTDGEHYYQGSEEYSFTNLKSNTEYKVYVKAVNKSNLESEPYIIDAKTNDIEEVTYEVDNPDGWAYTKTVTINYPEEEDGTYVKQYSLDNGNSWSTYTKPLVIEKDNQTVIARVKDGTENVKVASTLLITKIDRTIPTVDMSGIPTEFNTGEDYALPTSYTVDESKSGGSVECTSSLGGTHTSTSTLPVGGQHQKI